MREVLKEYTPLAFRSEIVAKIRQAYMDGETLVSLTQKMWGGDRFSRPTIRKILDDEEINCQVPPVKVRTRGAKVKMT